MSDTPQVLLAHQLKTLKLPTFLREYDKLARQCAAGRSASSFASEISGLPCDPGILWQKLRALHLRD